MDKVQSPLRRAAIHAVFLVVIVLLAWCKFSIREA